MSIWRSITLGEPNVLDTTVRDQYTGEASDGSVLVDVAVCPSYHDRIRLSISEYFDDRVLDAHAQAILTPDEARSLVERLSAAIATKESP